MAARLLWSVGTEPDPDMFGVAVSHWGPDYPGEGRIHYVWVYRWFQLPLARIFGGAVYHETEETAWAEVAAMVGDPLAAQSICQRCAPGHCTDLVPRYSAWNRSLIPYVVPVVVEDLA